MWELYLVHQSAENYKKYKQQTIVKNIVVKSKERSWKEFGDKLEGSSKGNQKLFYKILKNLRAGKLVKQIIISDANRGALSENNKIIQRWGECFQAELKC